MIDLLIDLFILHKVKSKNKLMKKRDDITLLSSKKRDDITLLGPKRNSVMALLDICSN